MSAETSEYFLSARHGRPILNPKLKQIPDNVDDIAGCIENCKQEAVFGNVVLATKWYLRTMLRVRQDAYCTCQPESAYGAILRVHRKLIRSLRPLQGTKNPPDVGVLQHEQLEWLLVRTVANNLPSPTVLLEMYSDVAVGYDREKQKIARQRQKRQKIDQTQRQQTYAQWSAWKEEQLDQSENRKRGWYGWLQGQPKKRKIESQSLPVQHDEHRQTMNDGNAFRLEPLQTSLLPNEPEKEPIEAPKAMQMYSEQHWFDCRKRFVDERLSDVQKSLQHIETSDETTNTSKV